MDNGNRNVNAGLTAKQFFVGCLIYASIGAISLFKYLGYIT
tara:strand:+ start:375 stop:497 length:123 start_codon:yes stop_codon:yes gene_type:complete